MECHKGQFWDVFLFLLYMNELPLNNQDVKMVLFADDMYLVYIEM
jgi:hypothetical protein